MIGERLRAIRESLGLTLRDVETKSREIAEARENPEFSLSAGRLCNVENSNSLPSIYKLATMCIIYRLSYSELLNLYGVVVRREGSDRPLNPSATNS